MAKLTFYLSPAAFSADAVQAMVMLPTKINYAAGTYLLIAAMTTDAQHTALLGAVAQPMGWDGSVAMAKALLRSADLTHCWWLYDHFIAVQDADRATSLRSF